MNQLKAMQAYHKQWSQAMVWLCLLMLGLGSTAYTGFYRGPSLKIKTVVLDAGHGGKDPGCLGKLSHEADVTLEMVLALGKMIEEKYPTIKVIYTREDDTFIELNERTAIANKVHADLFISIHCNSGSKKAVGTETYVMGLHTSNGNLEVAKRENSVILKEDNYIDKYDGFDPKSPLAHIIFANMQSAHLANSLKFANLVENQFKAAPDRKSNGVKQAGFLVLWKTAMPSVLIEIGYLSHPKEERYLNSDKGVKEVTGAIFKAFEKYRNDIAATSN